MDDPTIDTQVVSEPQASPAPVAVATPSARLEPEVKPDLYDKQVEFYKRHPNAARNLIRDLGGVPAEDAVTKEEFREFQLGAARKEALLQNGLDPEKHGRYLRGLTDAGEIAQAAKDLAGEIGASQAGAGNTTQPSAATGTSARNEPVVINTPTASKPEIKSVDDAVNALAAIRDSRA
jgi:hypothetical protein